MVEVFGTILAVLLSANATPDPLNAKGLLMVGFGPSRPSTAVRFRGFAAVTVGRRVANDPLLTLQTENLQGSGSRPTVVEACRRTAIM
jgi:hypothetical protein